MNILKETYYILPILKDLTSEDVLTDCLPQKDIDMISKHIYFTYHEIFKAYEDCIQNKRNSNNAIMFTQDKIQKLVDLCNEINYNTYEIGPSITFIVKYPVYREVFAADFRDRIIHHLVMNELMPYIEKHFINNSFSCREGKGVMYGVKTMQQDLDEFSHHGTIDTWVGKFDIKSFFMSINKELLANMIAGFICMVYPNNRKKQRLIELSRQIIMHHPEKNCFRKGDIKAWNKLPFGKSLFDVGEKFGLPIGNLTSQIFANFYLSVLDNYVTKTLGLTHYGRYVDDFVIYSHSKKGLKEAIKKICSFMEKTMGIKIHPKKRYIQFYKKGFKFTGGVIRYDRKYILSRTAGSLCYKMDTEFKTVDPDKAEKLVSVVNSYIGFMIFYDSYNLRKHLFKDLKILDEWEKAHIIRICKDYRKIELVRKPKKRYTCIADLPIMDDNDEVYPFEL